MPQLMCRTYNIEHDFVHDFCIGIYYQAGIVTPVTYDINILFVFLYFPYFLAYNDFGTTMKYLIKTPKSC